MRYSKSADFNGNTAGAFAMIIATLTACGFKLLEHDGRALKFAGPTMFNSRENALIGASRIEIASSGRQLTLEAELSGIDRLIRRVVVLLAVIVVIMFGVVLTVSLRKPHPPSLPFLLATGLGPIAPWIVLAPVMTRVMRRRTIRALDALVENAALAARPST